MSASVIASLFFNLFSTFLKISSALKFLSEIMFMTILLSSLIIISILSSFISSRHNMQSSTLLFLKKNTVVMYCANLKMSSFVGILEWHSIIAVMGWPRRCPSPTISTRFVLIRSIDLNSCWITLMISTSIPANLNTPLALLSRTLFILKSCI